jgi:hypothetical protein
MKQIFRNYLEWEDWQRGMYAPMKPELEERMIEDAIQLLSNSDKCLAFMERVTITMPIATLVNLTNLGCNRKAWIGQASCFEYAGCVDLATRIAWWKLEPQQQNEANEIAKLVINEWEQQCLNKQLVLMF